MDDLAAEEKIMTCFIRHRETTATFAERREGRKEEKVGRLKSNNTSSPLFSPSAAGLWLPRRMENATLHCRDFPSLPLIQLFFTSALVCMLGTDSSSPSNNETEKMKGEEHEACTWFLIASVCQRTAGAGKAVHESELW